ncbi:hypothetical protein [Rahnella perminowiae]|uniref:hypothetical protein n=1 Tax=Rahnella perminowiae TaxID=2816244 RepID=UPI00215BCD4A|nr:hypothetical protein [Rahnella perminowiae]MCR9000060.1 hypothetical protein [Rahnella perminowiae]
MRDVLENQPVFLVVVSSPLYLLPAPENQVPGLASCLTLLVTHDALAFIVSRVSLHLSMVG